MSDFEIVHFVPGRLRVRLAQVRRDPSFGRDLEGALAMVPGIRSVQTRPLTGSVLVEYDSATLDLDSLLALGRMLDVIPENMPPLGASRPSDVVGTAVRLVSESLTAVVEHGSRLAGHALRPQVAISTVALNTLVHQFGVASGLALTPGLAVGWILASLLLGPQTRPPAKQ